MDKYLTYSVVERKDPQNPEVAGKFYAQAQARGEAGIRELSQRIQQTCTVTRADVMAVGDTCGRDGGVDSTGGRGG